jgi:Mycobacterium 19 kDa lipoprotein antigen
MIWRVLIAVLAMILLTPVGCASADSPSGTLVIDGKDQNVDGEVSCHSHAGGNVMEVSDRIFVVIRPGSDLVVNSVDFVDSTGTKFVARDDGLSARRDGDFTVITGQAVPESEPTSTDAKSFELRMSCGY